MGGVAEYIHALSREVGRIDRTGIPDGMCIGLDVGGYRNAGQRCDFLHKLAGGAHADGHGFGKGLTELTLQPLRGSLGDFRVEHDIEVGVWQALQIGRAGAQGGYDGNIHAHAAQELADFLDVITVAKAQGAGAQDVAARAACAVHRACRIRLLCQATHQVVEGLGSAPVFLALVGRQLQCHHRNGQVQRLRQAARIVLNQLGGARSTHQHGLGRKPVVRVFHGGFEQLCRIATEVTRLEGGVGHRRAAGQALDHGEQQVGVGVALGCVHHVMHIRHGRGHAHGADVRRAFVCPECELHGVRLLRRPA